MATAANDGSPGDLPVRFIIAASASIGGAQHRPDSQFMPQKRQILITSALPYANGPLHLGHILEAIQADIWARFQRLRGHECVYLCADDAHGTAIMLKAEAENVSPEQLVQACQQQHLADYRGFQIAFDNFHSTHSDENRAYCEEMFRRCQAGGHIAERDIVQAFDPHKKIFLADRFIRGDCPKCGAADQYGDNCENCGASYSPGALRNPRSALSGATPEQRQTHHYFFRVPNFRDQLEQWLKRPLLQAPVVAKLQEWLEAGLQEWDITRDAPYFGFQLPDKPDKYFYVWMDAPIGYMASSRNLCDRNGDDFDRWWAAEASSELYHFIGKDIINFHGLFWPALLLAGGHRLPDAIFAHGFLTINGEKMSKSRGTLISAEHYLQHLDSDYLRYYFAARLDSGIQDIDLNLDDFADRVNADLVGKIINIASRSARFIEKNFDNRMGQPDAPALIEAAEQCGKTVAEHFEKREYSRAIREISALADETNRHIDTQAPWVRARKNPADPAIQMTCTTGLSVFRLLMLYLKPVIPEVAARSEAFLDETLNWENLRQNNTDRRIQPFKPLLQRIDAKQNAALLASANTS